MCGQSELQLILNRVALYSREVFGNRLKEVILYGSYARGEQEDDSDIDIMILVDDDPKQLMKLGARFDRLDTNLAMAYGVMVAPAIQAYNTFRAWRKILPFYHTIDTEGIRIHA